MTREEAIKYLERADITVGMKVKTKTAEAIDMAIKALKQEPKTGRWRAIYQGDEVIDYRCSECEFGNTFGKSTWGMNYCPYCGARMETR